MRNLALAASVRSPPRERTRSSTGCTRWLRVSRPAWWRMRPYEVSGSSRSNLHSKARSICAAFLGYRPACRRAIRRFAWLFRIDANLKDLNRIRELAEFSPVFNTLTQGTHVAVTSVRSRGPRRRSRLEGRTGSGPARRDALLQDPTPISSTFLSRPPTWLAGSGSET